MKNKIRVLSAVRSGCGSGLILNGVKILKRATTVARPQK